MAISSWNAGIIRPVAVAPTGPYQNGAAPGVWTLDQVAYWTKQGLWPTAGLINQGQQAFTTAGTFSWVAPVGITSVSVVCVGGGGGGGNYGASGGALAYINSTAVTPGSSYTVVVGVGGTQKYAADATNIGGNSSFTAAFGTCTATGGRATGSPSPTVGTKSGTFTGGGNGGTAQGGAGGGAGGYSGNGGAGDGGGSRTGAGGGGAGGYGGGGGGGVGILGEGANGEPTGVSNYAGGGGSGGTAGDNYQYTSTVKGGLYGGGAGGPDVQAGTITGGGGAVRIIWPGATRYFPSTNTGDL